jgi:hypothetical protein
MVRAEAEGMAFSNILVRSVSERDAFMRGALDVRQACPSAHAAQSASATAVVAANAVSVVSIYRDPAGSP